MAACAHDPHKAVLIDFASDPQRLFDPHAQPQYVRFEDELTESVLGELVRIGWYRIAPENSPLLCPEDSTRGRHGYILRLSVDTVMADSAFATFQETCISHGRPIVHQISYLLRYRGKWKVEKAVMGSVIILA
jgi:hypothetical protein